MKRRFREAKLLRRRERRAVAQQLTNCLLVDEDCLNQAVSDYLEKDEQERIIKEMQGLQSVQDTKEDKTNDCEALDAGETSVVEGE